MNSLQALQALGYMVISQLVPLRSVSCDSGVKCMISVCQRAKSVISSKLTWLHVVLGSNAVVWLKQSYYSVQDSRNYLCM